MRSPSKITSSPSFPLTGAEGADASDGARYAGMAVAMAWRLASALGDMLRGEAARIELGDRRNVPMAPDVAQPLHQGDGLPARRAQKR